VEAIEQLRERLARIADLNAAQAVLAWDQETYMPPGAGASRAHQLATLGRLTHELLTDPAVGELLAQVEAGLDAADPDSDDARLVKVAQRDFDRATRMPSRLVADLAQATSLAQQAWKTARSENDFRRFRPHLERVLELTLEKAEAFGYEQTPYDALLDEYEPDMLTATVESTFEVLRAELVPLVRAIGDRPQPDATVLYREYGDRPQWEFGLQVIRDFGFDFRRGRQDRSAHPFSTNFSVDDVRITTRVQQGFLPSCLFGTLHEAGHAMYEQGVDPGLDRSPLAAGTSLGMHESQSRLWENLVGRSRPFWRHYYPRLQAIFPAQLGEVAAEAFYRAINRVEPSLIRVEADEVTYNLHIMIRFDLERRLVAGELAVADLPEAWNEASRELLGLVPTRDADGVMQDIHWSIGAIGYFPTYTLGNLISAQLHAAVLRDIPELDEQIGRADFAPLLGWLRDKVHRHGRKFSADELLHRITGGGLEADSWLAYIRDKFGTLYDL
jgi:carboxypeptidase Taq